MNHHSLEMKTLSKDSLYQNSLQDVCFLKKNEKNKRIFLKYFRELSHSGEEAGEEHEEREAELTSRARSLNTNIPLAFILYSLLLLCYPSR